VAVLARPPRLIRLASLLAGLAGCRPALAPRLTREGQVRLRHRAPDARAVSVVGDFNHWEPGHDPMRPLGDGLYEALLQLPPGAYVYAFAEESAAGPVAVVSPEQAPAYVEDDLGGRSGLLSVPVTSSETARP
jgi:1,4-alpha-glucan branching enzyme